MGDLLLTSSRTSVRRATTGWVGIATAAAAAALVAGCGGNAESAEPSTYSPQASAEAACDEYCSELARLDALKCDFQPEDPAGCAALLTDKSTLAWKVSTALENRDADGVYRPAGEEVQQINAAIHDVTSTDFADERCYVPTANATKASTCGMIALSKDMAFTTLTLRLRTLAGLA